MKSRIIYALLATILLISAARADINAVLDNGIGARGAAMGFAQVADPKGVDGIYWNPAALAKNDAWQLSTFSSDVYGTNYKTIGTIFPGWGGQWGLLAVNAEQGAIMETNLDANGRPSFTGSLFGYGARALYLSYAKELECFSFGANIKYLNESLKDKNANGLGLDLGVQAKPAPFLTVGGKFENLLSTPMKWNTDSGQSDKTIPSFRLGASVSVFKGNFLLNGDIGMKGGNSTELFLGGEYNFVRTLFLRGGLSSGRPSIGVGLSYKNLTIDYSYVKGDDFLEDSQRINLSFAFGPGNVEIPYPLTANRSGDQKNYQFKRLTLLKSPLPRLLPTSARLP